MSDKSSVTFRFDHIALMLSPFAVWFSRPSAWYDLIDWLLYGLVTGFVLLTFAIGIAFLWAVHQPIPWLRERLKEGVITTDFGESIIPTFNKPDQMITVTLAIVVWVFALLTEDCVALTGLFIVGCGMFPLAVPQGRRMIKELKEALAEEEAQSDREAKRKMRQQLGDS